MMYCISSGFSRVSIIFDLIILYTMLYTPVYINLSTDIRILTHLRIGLYQDINLNYSRSTGCFQGHFFYFCDSTNLSIFCNTYVIYASCIAWNRTKRSLCSSIMLRTYFWYLVIYSILSNGDQQNNIVLTVCLR